MITAEIKKVRYCDSQLGGKYYDVLFTDLESKKSYRSCIYEKCRNFSRWEKLLKAGTILKGLQLITKRGKTFVDADSHPVDVTADIQNKSKRDSNLPDLFGGLASV